MWVMSFLMAFGFFPSIIQSMEFKEDGEGKAVFFLLGKMEGEKTEVVYVLDKSILELAVKKDLLEENIILNRRLAALEEEKKQREEAQREKKSKAQKEKSKIELLNKTDALEDEIVRKEKKIKEEKEKEIQQKTNSYKKLKSDFTTSINDYIRFIDAFSQSLKDEIEQNEKNKEILNFNLNPQDDNGATEQIKTIICIFQESLVKINEHKEHVLKEQKKVELNIETAVKTIAYAKDHNCNQEELNFFIFKMQAHKIQLDEELENFKSMSVGYKKALKKWKKNPSASFENPKKSDSFENPAKKPAKKGKK